MASAFLTPDLQAQSIPSISPASQSVLGGSGTLNASISATTGVNWTASSNAAWLTVSPGGGSGNGSIQYSFTINSTGVARTGTITATSSSGSTTLTVTQAAIGSASPTVTLQNSLTGGNLPSQTQQTLQISINDPSGGGYIGGVTVTISNFYVSPYACQMLYYPQYNTFYFVNNTLSGSTSTAYTLGTAGQQASGTHCGLNVAASSATTSLTSATGSVVLNLALTLQPSAVGKQNVYVNAYDAGYEIGLASQNNPNFYNSMAGWTGYSEITTAGPTVSMAQAPVTGQNQVLHYKYSDGNGYTYLSAQDGQISAGATYDTPCGFSVTPPNSLNLYYISGGNYTWMGAGAIGGAWSTGTNGVIGQTGQCWIDLNNSKVHVNPNPALPDPDPNSGLYPDLYVDLSTSLDPPTETTLPLNLYLSDEDVSPSFRYVSDVFSGTWPAFPALSISTGTLPSGVKNTAYSTAVSGAGGTGSYTWSATGLPSPLTISTGGTISGTPSAAGTFSNVLVTLNDTVSGQSANKTFSLVIVSPTTTTLTSSLNPSVAGTQITLTAAVTPATATGIVTFEDGSTTLGTGTITSSSAIFTTASLSFGSHSLVAIYGGDANDIGSTSATLTQNVTSNGSLSGLSPASSGEDTAISITITGNATHFSTASVVTFNGTGVTVGTPTAATATSLTAPVTIAANAPLGTQGVQVVSGSETVSLANAFTVTAGTTNSLSYTYDSQGRLSTAAYTSPVGTVTVTYSYDAAGNRTSVVTQ